MGREGGGTVGKERVESVPGGPAADGSGVSSGACRSSCSMTSKAPFASFLAACAEAEGGLAERELAASLRLGGI